ncbi:MAG TPA: hypothetical protein VGJ73_03910 [Verrucomicrobiae bacterium]|jgi:integrase
MAFERYLKSVPCHAFLEKLFSGLAGCELPGQGMLFQKLVAMDEKHRASLFQMTCRRLGIKGISLHSYRYLWAERAKVAGMPERFTQEALGHNSKAVHRAYAKKGSDKNPLAGRIRKVCDFQALKT